MRDLRGTAKRCVERILVAGGVPRLGRIVHRRDVAILAYHNVVPDGSEPAGDRSLQLPESDFAEQLDVLTETHRVVPLGRLSAGDRAGAGPTAVITFDDAYVGALTAGLDRVVERGLPATVFVSPGLLGRRSLWWDRLAETDRGLSPSLRSRLLTEEQGRQDRIERWAESRGLEAAPIPEHATTGTVDEVREAAARPGITLGSHTWSHPNLAALPQAEVGRELRRADEWLRSECPEGRVLPWLAYPYGLWSDAVLGVASGTGIRGALRVDGGVWREGRGETRSRLAVPRVNVPAGVSSDGFRLRAAGVLGG